MDILLKIVLSIIAWAIPLSVVIALYLIFPSLNTTTCLLLGILSGAISSPFIIAVWE